MKKNLFEDTKGAFNFNVQNYKVIVIENPF